MQNAISARCGIFTCKIPVAGVVGTRLVERFHRLEDDGHLGLQVRRREKSRNLGGMLPGRETGIEGGKRIWPILSTAFPYYLLKGRFFLYYNRPQDGNGRQAG